jgi:hypothetical protein
MVVETFVPHETPRVVWPIWYTSEQFSTWKSYYFTVLEDHSVPVHVGYATQHVAKGVFASGKLIISPLLSIIKESGFSNRACLLVNKDTLKFGIECVLCFLKLNRHSFKVHLLR